MNTIIMTTQFIAAAIVWVLVAYVIISKIKEAK
jgi:hypothetical protein